MRGSEGTRGRDMGWCEQKDALVIALCEQRVQM